MSDPKDDLESLTKAINERNEKHACPKHGKTYCEYPYCNCKEKTYETK